MKTLRAKRLADTVPQWAILERQLFRLMDETPEYVLAKYARADGSLLWPQDPGYTSTDALDDMYESFHNWPLYYFLGGHEKFLALSHREYDAITEQFTRYQSGHGHPIVVKEFEQGYDWMHQGEGYLFFYLLNLADPQNERNKERSLRYAGFYLNEDPDAINFDYERRMFRCCYLGSKGAAHRNFDDTHWMWADWKQWYGLPFHDLPGIATIDDMRDPEKARRMADAMRERLAYSDTVVNLLCTSMILNAFLHTGEDKYRDFVLGYYDAWRARARENAGLIPDNVGRDGTVGGDMKGKWYGGYYGWTWPHGFYFIADALAVAGENAALLTGDVGAVDLLRDQYQRVGEHAVEREGMLFFPQKHGDPGAVQEYNASPNRFLTVPDKTTDNPSFQRLLERDGWYEFCSLPQSQTAHMWFLSRAEADMEFIWKTRDLRARDWERLNDLYSKYQGGQDAAYMHYLRGGFSAYPETILRRNIEQVFSRMKFMREDAQPASEYGDAYLQMRNPITVEGLVELTLGGPMPIYNGGLLQVSVCYLDPDAGRPGLPPDVAALVSRITAQGIHLELRNLHLSQDRRVIVQAGAFSEHRFLRAEADGRETDIGAPRFLVELPAGCVIHLSLRIERFANVPTYARPI